MWDFLTDLTLETENGIGTTVYRKIKYILHICIKNIYIRYILGMTKTREIYLNQNIKKRMSQKFQLRNKKKYYTKKICCEIFIFL